MNLRRFICIVQRKSSCLPVRQQAPFRRRTLPPGVSYTFRDPGGIFICHRSCKQPQPLLPLFAGREQAKIGICCRLQIQAEVEKPNLMLAGGRLGGLLCSLRAGGRKKQNGESAWLPLWSRRGRRLPTVECNRELWSRRDGGQTPRSDPSRNGTNLLLSHFFDDDDEENQEKTRLSDWPEY